MESIDPRQLLIKVADILDQLDIPYMVTGGIAVLIWGRPRFTADIDIVIELKISNIDALSSALLGISEFGYVDKDTILEAFSNNGEFNFIDGTTGVKVDFWVTNKNSPRFLEFKNRVARDVLGHKVYFISPEDLILSKLLWYKTSPSSRHIEDVESVIKISGEELDKEYLKKRALRLGVSDELKALLEK